VLGVDGFGFVAVIANAALVSEELAGSDGPGFLREGGAIFLDGGIEIEFAGGDEFHRGGCGDRFGERGDAENGIRGDGDAVFDVSKAVGAGEKDVGVVDDGEGKAWDVVGGDVGFNERIELRWESALGG